MLSGMVRVMLSVVAEDRDLENDSDDEMDNEMKQSWKRRWTGKEEKIQDEGGNGVLLILLAPEQQGPRLPTPNTTHNGLSGGIMRDKAVCAGCLCSDGDGKDR